ncbi:hypothetical protein Tco_1239828 [Tanacetum coccineum]
MFFPHKKTFPTPTLTQKLFSNMKRASKGYYGVDIPLFPTMLTTPESSPSRITSSRSLSPQTHPSTSQPPSTPQSNQTTPEAEEDPSNQGRSLIEELDLDAGISLVPSHAANQGRIDDTQITRRIQSDENVQTYTKRRIEVSTDNGKAIMHESEPPKKIKKRVQVKMSVDEELAKNVFKEEQARLNAEHEARFKAEQEQERNDFETALELQKQLDEREEVAAKVDQAHYIDWSDPAVLRYH